MFKVLITGIHPTSNWSDTQKARFIGRHAYIGGPCLYHMDENLSTNDNGPFATSTVVFVQKGVVNIPSICIHGFTYKKVKKGRSSSCYSPPMPPL